MGVDLAVQPRALTAPPSFTVGTLRKAIPAHCFDRSLFWSCVYLIADLSCIVSLGCGSQLIDHPYVPRWLAWGLLWPLYWFLQGAVATGVWVIAHECGHQAFSKWQSVNDGVGLVLHSALLVPYYSWKHSHRRHHSNTCNVQKDEVRAAISATDRGLVFCQTCVVCRKLGGAGPALSTLLSMLHNLRYCAQLDCQVLSLDPSLAVHSWTEEKKPVEGGSDFMDVPIVRFFCLARMLLLGWPLYLMANVSGREYDCPTSHFDPYSPIYSKRERSEIVVSDAALALVACSLYSTAKWLGWAWFCKVYLVPYLIVNFWLVMITLLQHTHPGLPHYHDTTWDWLRGALSTCDRSYGFLDHFHHHIADTHVLHHLFSTIPHYNAQEATAAIRPILGNYYNHDSRNVFSALWHDYPRCNYVAPDAEGEEALWYRR